MAHFTLKVSVSAWMKNYVYPKDTRLGIQHDDRHTENTVVAAVIMTTDCLLSQKFNSTKSNACITITSIYFSTMLLNSFRHDRVC